MLLVLSVKSSRSDMLLISSAQDFRGTAYFFWDKRIYNNLLSRQILLLPFPSF